MDPDKLLPGAALTEITSEDDMTSKSVTTVNERKKHDEKRKKPEKPGKPKLDRDEQDTESEGSEGSEGSEDSEDSEDKTFSSDDSDAEIENLEDTKRMYIIELQKFRRFNYDVANLDMKAPLRKFKAEFERLRGEQAFRQKLKFFRFMIWGITWLVEKGYDKIGIGEGLRGWSAHIKANIETFDE